MVARRQSRGQYPPLLGIPVTRTRQVGEAGGFAIAEEDGDYFALKELRLDCVEADEIPLD